MVSSRVLFAGFLALIAVERLVELAISKRNAARAFAEGAVELGRGHFRVMSAVHALFFPACLAEVFWLDRAAPGVWAALAFAAALGAQALRYWAIATLGPRWNVRIIVVPGAPPVTGGPYRYIRHPNYVAVIVEFLAVPLCHGAWLAATVFTLLNAALLFVRIRAEERALGSLYADAFADRPRFVPAVRSRSG
ncbi:MAG: hypothetical protein IRZ16_20175 [Myxococcaceae bacterium]|nr:hypothetical protein [Myxococcaceae bacterium]